MADAFNGNAFLEVSMERDGGARVTGLFEDVDPAILKPLEGFDVVGRVGELNSPGRDICHRLRFVRAARVS